MHEIMAERKVQVMTDVHNGINSSAVDGEETSRQPTGQNRSLALQTHDHQT